jgi:hypothetical protein
MTDLFNHGPEPGRNLLWATDPRSRGCDTLVMDHTVCASCYDLFPTADHVCPQRKDDSMEGGDPRFLRILDEMRELHVLKAQDYGEDEDPLANLRASEDLGIPAWIGTMVRAKDKVKRIEAFVKNGKLANEGVIDSLNDLACYAILARILYEETLS